MKDTSFHDHVLDLLADVPGVTSRAMFGGWGIYRDKTIFAIIADSELYFKVGPHNKVMFEAIGSHPFMYEKGKKAVTMSYWLVPEEVMEDRERLLEFVDAASGKKI